MSTKGGSYERQICRQLSLWWTDGTDDSCFWRTAGSGAMAKTRSKVGKTTFGQYGDIHATNPIGQPLIDKVTIELKRGYKKWALMDVLDAPLRNNKPTKQTFEKFLDQVKEDMTNAKTKYYMVITRRDSRRSLIHIPRALAYALSSYNNLKEDLDYMITKFGDERVVTMRLEDFFSKPHGGFFNDK